MRDGATHLAGGRDDRGPAEEKLVRYLVEAHAMERQSVELLRRAAPAFVDPQLQAAFERHLEQTREHERRIGERLAALGAGESVLKEAAMSAGARAMAWAAQASEDTAIRFTTETVAFETLEIVAYGILCRLATRAGDTATVRVVAEILEEEEEMAEQLAGSLDRVVELALR